MSLIRLNSLALLATLATTPAARCAEEPPPTIIDSTKLEMWSNVEGTETRAIFTGNVTVTGNEMKLTCDRLDITADRIGDKSATIGTIDKFRALIATGKVNIIQGDREASCGRAEIYPRQDKIILTEKPVVIDHANGSVATGDPLIMFRGERRVQGGGIEPVHITLPAMKNLGFDKNQPAPKPENSPAPTAPAPAPATPSPAK
jgi:lipopolysaccharide export system protein LptA